MDFIIILTLIGFLISLYSISEEHKKKNLIFKINYFDKILFILLFSLMLFLIILNIFITDQNSFRIISLGNFLITWNLIITILLILLSTCITILFWIILNSIKIKNKKSYFDNLKSVLNKNNFSELTNYIEIYFEEIFFCKKEFSKPFKMDLINNPGFINYITKNNVNLVLKILFEGINEDESDLWNKIANNLINNQNSRLYFELDESFNGNKKIINYIFNDLNKCQKALIWRPIGEEVINYLKTQRKLKIDENNIFEERYDTVKNKSKVHIGIQFFDNMLNRAFKNNFEDHMWVYYLNYWVKEICDNIKYYGNTHAEFSNMYEYYLYKVFLVYKYLINSNKNLSNNNENVLIESSIESLNRSFELIALSKILRPEFKKYLRNIYLEIYFKLAESKNKKMLNYFNNIILNKTMSVELNKETVLFLESAIKNHLKQEEWHDGLHYNNSKLLKDFKNILKQRLNVVG